MLRASVGSKESGQGVEGQQRMPALGQNQGSRCASRGLAGYLKDCKMLTSSTRDWIPVGLWQRARRTTGLVTREVPAPGGGRRACPLHVAAARRLPGMAGPRC